MVQMSEKFKGYKVTSPKSAAGDRALSKSELQDVISKKRQAVKAKEVETGEQGGPEGPEPTRYGDWEIGGRASDF